MSEPVKSRRRYDSSRRQAQAQNTRLRILEAAHALFIERGFAGTTIAAIAAAGDVAEETIYATFKTKVAILDAALQRAVLGADAGAFLDQPGPAAVKAARSQRAQVEIFAQDMAARMARVAPLMGVLQDAAKSEPELARFYDRIHANRLLGLSRFVDALRANGTLALEREAANQTVWALASPELYTLLSRNLGWDAAAYADWLQGMILAALIPAR
jgi:AcrR family transcriptional regulator